MASWVGSTRTPNHVLIWEEPISPSFTILTLYMAKSISLLPQLARSTPRLPDDAVRLPLRSPPEYLHDFGIDSLRDPDDLDDFGIDALRFPSPDAACATSPTTFGTNALLPSSQSLDDFGIDALRAPSPITFGENAVPPSSHGLDDFGIDALRAPSPDSGRAPSPTTLGENALPSLHGHGLEDFGIDALRAPSPKSGRSPSPIFGENALLPRTRGLEDFGIDMLRYPSPDSGSAPSPTTLGADALPPSSHEGGLDDFGIDALRAPSPTIFGENTLPHSSYENNLDDFGIDELCSPLPYAARAPSQASPVAFGANVLLPSSDEDDLKDFGIDALHCPSPDSGRASSRAASVTNARSKSQICWSSDYLHLILGIQNVIGERPHPLSSTFRMQRRWRTCYSCTYISHSRYQTKCWAQLSQSATLLSNPRHIQDHSGPLQKLRIRFASYVLWGKVRWGAPSG